MGDLALTWGSRRLCWILFVVLTFTGLVTAQTSSVSMGVSSATDVAFGFYFDIQAAKNLSVESLDFVSNFISSPPNADNPDLILELWTVKGGGSYVGHMGKSSDWERLALVDGISNTLPTTSIPLNLQLELFMAAGEQRGFYIHRTNGGAIYGSYQASGTVIASNQDLSVLAGDFVLQYFGSQPNGGGPGGAVHYNLHPANPIDLELKEILSPQSSQDCSALGLETVSVELRQLGTTTVPAGTQISFQVDLDGASAFLENWTLSQTLSPGQSLTHTLTTLLNCSAPGAHDLKVTLSLSGDGFAANDTKELRVWSAGVARVSSFPWMEDFDPNPHGNVLILPPGWEHDPFDGVGFHSDWRVGPGLPFVPDVSNVYQDHTTGIPGVGSFALASDKSNFSGLRLLSPCLDLNGLSHPRLSFWIAMKDSLPLLNGVPEFFVDVIEMPSQTIHASMFGPYTGRSSHLGPIEWLFEHVDLSAFAGQTIRLVFRANLANGFNGSSYDLAIDDVMILDAQPAPGQNEQPGLASLELGETVNVNGDPLYAQTGGPYYTSLSDGDPLVFVFEGQPNQAIYLLFGFLNPVSATFPNVGQMDIGNTINPLTGLPNGIAILADGTNPIGFNPLFVTNSLGKMQFSMVMPLYPPGFIIGAFQAAITTGGVNGSWVALSNAIQLSSN